MGANDCTILTNVIVVVGMIVVMSIIVCEMLGLLSSRSKLVGTLYIDKDGREWVHFNLSRPGGDGGGGDGGGGGCGCGCGCGGDSGCGG